MPSNKSPLGLIQEPWAYLGIIKGLKNLIPHDLWYERPRTLILHRKDLNFAPITEFITRDLKATVGLLGQARVQSKYLIPGCDDNVHHTI